ncbi:MULTISPECIES: transposase [Pseudomonas]|uniref:Transposase n=1 Tax=Pseudomonas wuhanensis TaxID=2954098 RepID=A0ABY9GLF3_9PSED|nr:MULTISPECIES: transposase [unclassified Pseudomonas]WLI10770.1 transposase [Pseudomonas sp. FP603]WLI16591.1 transposase [Pseudomonas sp. FP607]
MQAWPFSIASSYTYPTPPLCVFGFAETALVNQAPAKSAAGLGPSGFDPHAFARPGLRAPLPTEFSGVPDYQWHSVKVRYVCLLDSEARLPPSMPHEEMSVFWTKVGKLFQRTCQSTDPEWQKRRRVIDTRLLVVFILKMVLSRNRQGYGSSLGALWESCTNKGITLPRTDAVAASSLCEARQKLPETVFKTLNDELISLWHAHRDTPTWKGHRVFAIDGSKINAPRGLLEYGYKTPRETTRHYPCAMVSGLYNLQEQLIYDFELVPHNDERRCVPEHLAKLEPGDLVIFDRGYFSYLILHQVLTSGQHAVFRLQQGTTNSQVPAFWDSEQTTAQDPICNSACSIAFVIWNASPAFAT